MLRPVHVDSIERKDGKVIVTFPDLECFEENIQDTYVVQLLLDEVEQSQARLIQAIKKEHDNLRELIITNVENIKIRK